MGHVGVCPDGGRVPAAQWATVGCAWKKAGILHRTGLDRSVDVDRGFHEAGASTHHYEGISGLWAGNEVCLYSRTAVPACVCNTSGTWLTFKHTKRDRYHRYKLFRPSAFYRLCRLLGRRTYRCCIRYGHWRSSHCLLSVSLPSDVFIHGQGTDNKDTHGELSCGPLRPSLPPFP